MYFFISCAFGSLDWHFGSEFQVKSVIEVGLVDFCIIALYARVSSVSSMRQP